MRLFSPMPHSDDRDRCTGALATSTVLAPSLCSAASRTISAAVASPGVASASPAAVPEHGSPRNAKPASARALSFHKGHVLVHSFCCAHSSHLMSSSAHRLSAASGDSSHQPQVLRQALRHEASIAFALTITLPLLAASDEVLAQPTEPAAMIDGSWFHPPVR